MPAEETARPSIPEADAEKWAPCEAKCPVHIDVPAYLAAVADGRFSDALAVILERNPLPAVCGRICLRPCEEECRRCLLDDPVAIAHLKRAAADHGVYPVRIPPEPRRESVGVVGAGPAGLTAAYDLAGLGYEVTVYEAESRLGGMLRYGIPTYRLSDDALDRDIGHILSLGVRVETGVRVGTDVTLDELRERHAAVVVAVGLQGSRPLPIPGADLPGVLAALPFLKTVAEGGSVELGERVVVVGGGNVAMDVARTALRIGASSVTAVCLESREEMPASPEEIVDAEGEGVTVVCSRGPHAVTGAERVEGLQVVECVSVFDDEGRFSPVFREGSEETLPADNVIFAVGQHAETEGLGLPVAGRGLLSVDAMTLATGVPNVFAAGDVVTGPTKVVDAIAAGHRAAAAVVGTLGGDWTALGALDFENEALGGVPEDVAEKIANRPRVAMGRLETPLAKRCFDEVERGYTESESSCEARRCLACTTGARLDRDKCAACLTCVRVCPHGAPVFQAGAYPDFAVEACHACGACVAECPALALHVELSDDTELAGRVRRALEASPEPAPVLLFVCGHRPELAASLGPSRVTIAVPCLLRVSERVVLEALDLGAASVAFGECVEETCRYPHAIGIVSRRTANLRRLIEEAGLGECLSVVGEPTPGGSPAKEADAG